MNRRLVIIFVVFSSYSLLFPDEAESMVGLKSIVHWGTKGVVSGVKSSAVIAKGVAGSAASGVASGVKASVAKGLAIPVIGAKKAFLVAPIAVPLALGAKALLAAKLAVPMGIGAAVGAPIGALIGAKAGALKGAVIGKAIIAAKAAAAKKVAITAAAIALKPVVLAAGVKAKVAGAKLALVGKGVKAAGAAVSSAGAKITSFSEKLSGLTSSLAQSLKPSLPSLSLPSLPSLPLTSSKSKGPTSIEYSFVVNGPHTGFKAKKASFYSSDSDTLLPTALNTPNVPNTPIAPQYSRGASSYRRRREAKPEPEPQRNTQQLLSLVRSQNAQQCLQRVICELSANPNAHGGEGARFGRSLLLLESQTDRTAAQQYRQAATTGTQVANGQQCANFYPSCAFQSNEIIRIGNQMIEG